MKSKNHPLEVINDTQVVNKVVSKDGTTIAFEKSGNGPALILVVGAFNDRATGAPLAQFLERHFTVLNYDRRGRADRFHPSTYTGDRWRGKP